MIVFWPTSNARSGGSLQWVGGVELGLEAPKYASRPRPPKFDRALYRRRNAVERRRVGWLEQNRRVGTRYKTLAVNDLAFVWLAMIRRYLHLLFSDRT